MARRKAFTVVEILLAVAVIGVLFGLIFAFYRSAMEKAKYVEAVATVDTISKAEEINQMNTGEYVAAANTQEVNEKLGLDIKPRWYNYKVIGVTDDNFIVLAEKILDDINSGNLSSEPIVIAKDRSGPVSPESVPSTEGESTPPDSGSPSGGPDGGGGPGGGTPSGGPGGGGGGGGEEDRTEWSNSITALLSTLDNSVAGHDNYNLLIDNDVNVAYADLLSMGALGLYIPAWWYNVYPDPEFEAMFPANSVFLDNSYQWEYPPEAGATVLMHEATHVDWDSNPDEWADYSVTFWNAHGAFPPLVEAGDLPIVVGDLSWVLDPITGIQHLSDSIVQEYTCFSNEAVLWKEYTGHDGSLTSPGDQEDQVVAAYDSGDLLALVADNYVGYPPYHGI